MKIISWRNATLFLLVVCGAQRYAACHRHRAPVADVEQQDGEAPRNPSMLPAVVTTIAGLAALPTPATTKPIVFHGMKVPGAIAHFLPQPGEKLRAYRDRIVPLAEAARAPQRARVERIRDELSLAPAQRADLDANVTETMTAIENRIVTAVATGELDPKSATPMSGIAVTRDILDTIDRGNTRFTKSLTDDQRTALAPLHFDYADYLVFSAPWENALAFLD